MISLLLFFVRVLFKILNKIQYVYIFNVKFKIKNVFKIFIFFIKKYIVICQIIICTFLYNNLINKISFNNHQTIIKIKL